MLFCWALNAQSIVVSENLNFSGTFSEEIKAPISITNNSNEVLHVGIKRLDATIGTSQKTWFCWDNDCMDTETDELNTIKRLNPGETINSLRSILQSGLVEGFSSVKYLIYNTQNPADAVEVDVNYTIENQLSHSSLYSSKQVVINDVYPNPVSEYAVVDYRINDLESEAKIVIHSVLGSIVGEYTLQPLETELKIKAESFNPGIYFYTLYIDNDGVMTRKLIVRK
ncbi:MAG: T9SS type A sorting domain-containing protein [Cyclobacteriaceae bacterium]|nr:T9SS type A sorting domain-containing protein [Cyclobacteriaceae bacterium]